MHDLPHHLPVFYIPEDRVGQKGPRNTQDRKTDAPPAQFRQHDQADDAGDDVEGILQLHLQSRVQQCFRVERIVEEGRRADHHQQDIIPGHVVGLHLPLLCRIGQVAHYDHQPQEGTEPYLLEEVGKQRHIDAEQGEQRQNDPDDDLRNPFPDARITLPVILAHDLINVRCDILFFVHSLCFHPGGRVLNSLSHKRHSSLSFSETKKGNGNPRFRKESGFPV